MGRRAAPQCASLIGLWLVPLGAVTAERAEQ